MSKLFSERAARGAAWLDKEHPGWAKRMDANRLDIGKSSCCVIGQLFGSFNDWCPDCPSRFILLHGFDCVHRKNKNFDKLTNAWQKEIQHRQAI